MISAVCFLSDDRDFRIWLGLFNRFSATTVSPISMASCSSPCCLAQCPHFPGEKAQSQHLTDTTDTSPGSARHHIVPGDGIHGAPHQTLALSSFQFLSPDLRSAHTLKPGICHDAVLLSYFLSFNPPWLSSEEKYLIDALRMTPMSS